METAALPWGERHDGLRLRASARENAIAQSGRRLGTRRRERERARDVAEGGELVTARFAALEMLLVDAPLVLVERVEGVARRQLVNSVRHDPSVPASSSSSRKRASPANIRLLMVPSGRPSLSASSDWLNPP